MLVKILLAGTVLDGAALDGEPLDGTAPDGDPLDGTAPDGEPLDGTAPDGDPLDGTAPDGDPLDGTAPDGEPLDGTAPDGEPLDDAAPDGTAPDRTVETPDASWTKVVLSLPTVVGCGVLVIVITSSDSTTLVVAIQAWLSHDVMVLVTVCGFTDRTTSEIGQNVVYEVTTLFSLVTMTVEWPYKVEIGQ